MTLSKVYQTFNGVSSLIQTKILSLVLALCIVMPAASQKEAVVKASVKGMPDSTMVLLKKYDSNSSLVDSTWAMNGKIAFTLHVSPGGDIFILQLGREMSVGNWLLFYVNEGELIIDCKEFNFYDYEMTGSLFAQEYNNYVQLLKSKKIFKELRKLNELLLKKEKNKDSALAEEIDVRWQELGLYSVSLAKKWIGEHPTSAVSSFILFVDIRGKVSLTELEKLLSMLDKQATANSWSAIMLAMTEEIRKTNIGQLAPAFTQNDTTGKAVSLADFRGSYLLIDFWASWCGPCRADNPHLVKLYNTYKERNFSILGVALERNRESWIKAINKDKLSWTHVSDFNFWKNEVAVLYNINAIPSNLLIDPNGIVVAKNLHGKELERFLVKVLQ